MSASTEPVRTGVAVSRAAGRSGRSLGAARLLINATARVSPDLAGRLALELWRRPWGRGPVRSVDLDVHRAAEVSKLVNGGRKVVTYSWGDGRRPILLVHGWRSRASWFAPLIRLLVEAGYSPVSYDAPGHGDTAGGAGTILDHEAIIAALAQRHARFEAIVAHSLGVPFALYAVRQGVAVPKFVSVSGVGRFGYLVDQFCADLRLHPTVADSLRRAIERSLFGGDTEIWQRFSADVAADCDLLVVHDAQDDVVHVDQAALIVGAYGARATYLQTDGLGHRRILGSPDVLAAVVDFVGEKAGRP